MRRSDALRIINKCKRYFPELDFTNTTLMDDNRYEYRFGAESSGHYNINVRNINIRIPSRDNTELGHWWVQEQYADLMGTIVHEAIHRKVHQDHGDDIIGHGIEFQRECLAFGLDPFRESNHDKEATDFLYPMNETDYKKYRSDWGGTSGSLYRYRYRCRMETLGEA